MTPFIVFDGTPCSGKSTLIHEVNRWLPSSIRRILYRDPTSGRTLSHFADLCMQAHATPDERIMAYQANRYFLCNDMDAERQSGHWVISDRWEASTAAFQVGSSVPRYRLFLQLHRAYLIAQPTVTFICITSFTEFLRRREMRRAAGIFRDCDELPEKDFERVFGHYLNMVDDGPGIFGDRLVLLDTTNLTIPEALTRVTDILKPLLPAGVEPNA